MKRLLYFVCVSLIMCNAGELHGAKKKKRTSYIPSFSLPAVKLPAFPSFSVPSLPNLPSLSALNPFSGKEPNVVLISDQKSSAQKKKRKQKKGVMTLLASAGTAVTTAPAAAWQSQMVQRLIKKTKKFGNSVLSIGPNTVRYAASTKGQDKIKSAVKNGLYYGIHYGVPLAVIVGGVKYLKVHDEQMKQFQSTQDAIHTKIGELEDASAEQKLSMSGFEEKLLKVQNGMVWLTEDTTDGDGNPINGPIKNLLAAYESLNGSVNEIGKKVGDFENQLKTTNGALTNVTGNLSALLKCLHSQQEAEMCGTPITSAKEALDYCKDHLNLQMRMQGALASQVFNVSSPTTIMVEKPEHLSEKVMSVYTLVRVEIIKNKGWFGAKVPGNILTAHKKDIEIAQENADENTLLLFWYKDESSPKGFTIIDIESSDGKKEE